ncbi:BatD family protein [Nannocystaceae bacterium ST9]
MQPRPLTRRRALGLAIGSLAGLALARSAHAAEVEILAVLSEEQTEVGQGVFLEVEVAVSDAGSVGQPRFANTEGLTIQNRGVSSGVAVQFGTGSRNSSRRTNTYTYVIVPSQPGEYEIDIEVEVDRVKYEPAIKPKLSVGGEALPDEPVAPEAGAVPVSADEAIIVWPVVDASKVYVGQQVVYELQIWSRVFGRLELIKLPTFKDFWTEELDIARDKRRALVAGVPYDVFTTMRRAVFPQRAGTLTIEGANLRSGGNVGLFGGGTPSREHYGPSFAITVEPLPAEGQPPGFSANNVGVFELSASVDRAKIIQGEALRLSVKLSGTGNIALVALGEWPKPAGMKTYEAKPETPKLDTKGARLRGERTWEMLLVAEQAGTLTIPAIELDYFDPERGQYRRAASKPITIEVAANPDAAPIPIDDEASEASPTSEPFAPPLAGDALARTETREPWLTPMRWWIGIATVPALLAIATIARVARERLGPDEQTRSRAAALGRRRQLLIEARAALESGEGFHAKLAEALQRAAVDRAGPQGIGLARGPLMALLRTRGVADDEVARLQTLLDSCDAARFGAGAGEIAARREQLEAATTLLESKVWRAKP